MVDGRLARERDGIEPARDRRLDQAVSGTGVVGQPPPVDGDPHQRARACPQCVERRVAGEVEQLDGDAGALDAVLGREVLDDLLERLPRGAPRHVEAGTGRGRSRPGATRDHRPAGQRRQQRPIEAPLPGGREPHPEPHPGGDDAVVGRRSDELLGHAT